MKRSQPQVAVKLLPGVCFCRWLMHKMGYWDQVDYKH